TPGPLILVTQFVALTAGFAEAGVGLAIAAACLTLWVTFTPCFLWIFAGAPYVETLLARPRLKGALDAISASVVGVILNLSLWFALHVLFRDIQTGTFGPLVNLSTLSITNASLVACATALLLGVRLPLIPALTLMGGIGAALGASGFFV
ncbi:MAG: chromate transporter, partial [Pseudomonadota bacterium]